MRPTKNRIREGAGARHANAKLLLLTSASAPPQRLSGLRKGNADDCPPSCGFQAPHRAQALKSRHNSDDDLASGANMFPIGNIVRNLDAAWRKEGFGDPPTPSPQPRIGPKQRSSWRRPGSSGSRLRSLWRDRRRGRFPGISSGAGPASAPAPPRRPRWGPCRARPARPGPNRWAAA